MMDLHQLNDVSSLTDTNVDTIILTLPVDDLSFTQLEIDNNTDSDGVILANENVCQDPTSPSLVKSDCGRLLLVTYNSNKEVVSKHSINLQLDTGNVQEIKNNGMDDQEELILYTQNPGTNLHDFNLQSSQISNQEDKLRSDTLQLAMQEIGSEADILEPVSYEVKLAALQAMIPTEHPTGKILFSCVLCSKDFLKKYELKAHLSQHLGLNISLCPICGKQFSHSSNLSRHMRIHTGHKPYVCKECGKRFNQTTSLHMHRIYAHGVNNRRYGCPSCGRIYKTPQLLKRHCKINHQDENIQLDMPMSQAAASKRQFYCTDCGERFFFKSQLKKHEAEHHVQQYQVSNQVEKNISSDLQLRLDVIDSMLREIQDESRAADKGKSSHQDYDYVSECIEEVIKKVNSFTCLECGKQFNRYISYKQHWGVHETSLRKFECKECGMAFAWKSTYSKHWAQYHSSSPQDKVPCSEPGCDKQYKSLSQMQEHVKRDHQMIRRFTCDICAKQFYKGHDLIVHKRTHTKEKPYMCGTCGKYFSHISHVIRHEKSHNNIRPYTCPVCQKSFTQATVLRAHRKKKCPEFISEEKESTI